MIVQDEPKLFPDHVRR